MNKKITIIGGGITGLVSAYLASRDGWDVTVLESEDNVGGLLGTFSVGGNQLEHYYHHFFTHDAELLWLLEELGIKQYAEFKKATMGVFRSNRIYDFNSGIDLLKFKPMNFLDKAKFLFSSLYLGKFAKWQDMEDISAMDWFYKHAGKNATESLWKPLLEVKFSSFADKVPASWMAGRLSQRMNSRKMGEEKLGYIKGSFYKIVEALMSYMKRKGVKIVTGAKTVKLDIENNRIKAVQTLKGSFSGGIFLFTMPTIYLARLFEGISKEYSDKLLGIKYSSAMCVVLEMKKKLGEVYWLNVADPGFSFGGIIEHTNLVSAEEYGGSSIAYLSKYFSENDSLAATSDSEAINIMLADVKKIYPDFKEDNLKNASVFRTNTAATLCDLNFSKKVPDCKSPIEGLYVASMPHIYPDERSCNNAIRVAAEACNVMGMDSSMVPRNLSLAGKIGMQRN